MYHFSFVSHSIQDQSHFTFSKAIRSKLVCKAMWHTMRHLFCIINNIHILPDLKKKNEEWVEEQVVATPGIEKSCHRGRLFHGLHQMGRRSNGQKKRCWRWHYNYNQHSNFSLRKNTFILWIISDSACSQILCSNDVFRPIFDK